MLSLSNEIDYINNSQSWYKSIGFFMFSFVAVET